MGASPWAKGSAISPSCRPAGSSARRTSPGEGIEVTACLPAAGATHACHVRTLRRRDVCRYLGPTLVCRPEKVLLPFAGCRLQTRAGLTPAVGVAPSRGLLLGSVSPLRGPARRSAPCVRADARTRGSAAQAVRTHPWRTRRRSASMRCSTQPPARLDHCPFTGVASKQRFIGAAPTRSHVEILPTRLSVSLGWESKKNGKPLGFPAQSGFRRRTVVVARPD